MWASYKYEGDKISNKENTNERPTDYSKWHREFLPSFCYMQDIDCIEYRVIKDEIVPVAIIETGRWDRVKFTDTQKKIVMYIADRLNIPVYFVEYFIDGVNNKFKVDNLTNDKNSIILRNDEYINFLINVGGRNVR